MGKKEQYPTIETVLEDVTEKMADDPYWWFESHDDLPYEEVIVAWDKKNPAITELRRILDGDPYWNSSLTEQSRKETSHEIVIFERTPDTDAYNAPFP